MATNPINETERKPPHLIRKKIEIDGKEPDAGDGYDSGEETAEVESGESEGSKGEYDTWTDKVTAIKKNIGTWSAKNWPLYKMIQKNDWEGAEEFLNDHPDVLTAKIAMTLFHLIFLLARDDVDAATSVIEKLAPKVEPTSLLVQKDSIGRTVLTTCAMVGNTKASKILVKCNADLPNIPDDEGYLPVYYAATRGHKDTIRYLVSVTAEENFKLVPGSRLLASLIKSDIYDIALDLLKLYPAIGRDNISSRRPVLESLVRKPLAFASGSRLGIFGYFVYNRIPVFKTENIYSIDPTNANQSVFGDVENPDVRSENYTPNSTAFGSISQIIGAVWDKLHLKVWNVLVYRVPTIKVTHDQKLTQMQMVEIIEMICEGVSWCDPEVERTLGYSFLLTAARLGISEIVNEILTAYSLSVLSADETNHNIFDLAVLNRREKVFNLIYSMGLYKDWIPSKDIHGNNLLHLAGKLVPSNELAGPALQMQRELQWFKAVENVVPPYIREDENDSHKTPREVFTDEHKELAKEGEKWMKDTASSCTIAVTLILTAVFAAAFTVQGGNNNGEKQNFLNDQSFLIFAISDALAIFFSVTSLLMFLGILASRYSEEDFLVSLPRQIIIGFITLFFSIASMMVAFYAIIYLVLSHPWKRVIILIALFGFIPVTLFAFLQFPLFLNMFLSTYGPSIFGPMM